MNGQARADEGDIEGPRLQGHGSSSPCHPPKPSSFPVKRELAGCGKRDLQPPRHHVQQRAGLFLQACSFGLVPSGSRWEMGGRVKHDGMSADGLDAYSYSRP